MKKTTQKNRIKLFAVLTIPLTWAEWCFALPNEAYYQKKWCAMAGGQLEYRLSDKTRVDCLTKNHAVEFDFAKKWAECVGQALYYGIQTGKKPACVLIIEKPSDFRYYYRIEKVADVFKFRLWYIKSPNYVYLRSKDN